jgi:hypothetical protein
MTLAACANSEECPSGTFSCLGICTDLLSDSSNCGACGTACDQGHVCTNGFCILSCQEGYVDCSGTCRDVMTDQYNCGTCGMTCAAGYLCIDGACAPDCPEGYTACSGVCKNLTNDPANCGDCANICAAGEVCMAGSCSFTCPAPYIDCSGSCADLDTDHLNCGACGNACLSGQVCEAGACQNSCIAGLTMCSGACADLMRDPENCGSCASRCGTGENCYDGACLAACPGGFTDCSGTCRDLDSDIMNCGACETECLVGERCTSGTCVVTCVAPLISCPHDSDGDTVMDATMCSDTRYDPANCGSCGSPCAPGEACVDGACRATTCPAPRWSDSFTARTTPTTTQCSDWETWRLGLDATGCASITISGTFDTTGATCSDPTVVAAIATALRTSTTGMWSCGGRQWHYCDRGSWEELWLDPGTSCNGSNCPNPGYLIRPCIGNSNWGGVNTPTCTSNPTQTMTVEFH